MIYIKTRTGWWYTGVDDEGQMLIRWNAYALVYWDSEKKDFMFPGVNGHARSRGMGQIPVEIKLKMWTMGKNFPVFNVNDYLKKMQIKRIQF